MIKPAQWYLFFSEKLSAQVIGGIVSGCVVFVLLAIIVLQNIYRYMYMALVKMVVFILPFCFLLLNPATQKVVGYYVIPSENFESLSVCRPSVSALFPDSNLSIF